MRDRIISYKRIKSLLTGKNQLKKRGDRSLFEWLQNKIRRSCVKGIRRQPSTRVKLNTNSPDTSACQTCCKTQYAPHYKKEKCAWSVFKSVSLTSLIETRKGDQPLETHQLILNSRTRGCFYLNKFAAILALPPFASINQFVIKYLWSWGQPKNDVSCYRSCNNLGRHYAER